MNVKNINKLINHLKSLKGNNFNMSTWVYFSGDTEIDWEEEKASLLLGRMHTHGDCGTSACLAGHTSLLQSAEDGDVANEYMGWRVPARAQMWLGLTDDQADLLFLPKDHFGYVIKFSREEAIETLERLLKTGQVLWPRPVFKYGEYSTLIKYVPKF